ncbi:hypothetical protein CPB86DRAFT_705006 [Serendipita vermifera]|nr:hypothetical protein CPB86DRAFT_705006 [Serendipita vermifera]
MHNIFNYLLSAAAILATARSQLVIPQIVMDQAPPLQEVIRDHLQNEETMRAPALSDQMSLEPKASIFFSYARESAKMSGVLSGVGEYSGNKYTVFVPTNKAIMTLARKPHQSDETESAEISEEQAERVSQENVERWVGAHIVPQSLPLEAASVGTHPTLLDEKSLVLSRTNSHKTPEWDNWKLNDKINILGQREAANGIMYLIDGTIEVKSE